MQCNVTGAESTRLPSLALGHSQASLDMDNGYFRKERIRSNIMLLSNECVCIVLLQLRVFKAIAYEQNIAEPYKLPKGRKPKSVHVEASEESCSSNFKPYSKTGLPCSVERMTDPDSVCMKEEWCGVSSFKKPSLTVLLTKEEVQQNKLRSAIRREQPTEPDWAGRVRRTV